jgi:hypothetical protein
MVKLENWEEFMEATQNLYQASPTQVRELDNNYLVVI